MIKRPLVWILGAYLLGICLAWRAVALSIIIIILMLLCFAIYLLIYRVNNRFINRKDQFLWCLPILLLLGFMAMGDQIKLPKLYYAFEQEAPCELSGQITMIVKKQWGQALYVKNNVVSISEGEPYYSENVIVYSLENQNYRIGNQITVQGSLIKFKKATNPGQFNEQQYYKIENIDFKVEAETITITDLAYSRYHLLLDQIKNKLIQVYASILADKEAGTLVAMLLGEKYMLDDEIKQLYQENGISHILAISGLHVSLIGMSIFWLLKKGRLPIVVATFLTIFMVYSYGELTNFSVSTNRAVVMMIVMLLSSLFGKTYDMRSAMAFSALIILLQNPLQLMSAGFLLSYGAVVGIAVIFPCLKILFPSKNVFLDSLLISASAMIATTPFVLIFFYQFPVYSVLTNLIILPFVTVLTLTSIAAGIAGAISMPIGIFLIGGSNYILKLYEGICRIIGSLPGNLITVGKPDAILVGFSIVLILIFLWASRHFQKRETLIILGVGFFILFTPHKNIGLEITILDVGQGDAIFIESKSGTTYLIDGGSADVNQVGTYRLLPFFKSQGVDELDYAIITHSDKDHISGLMELIDKEQIEIKNLVMPDITNRDKAYLKLETLALERKIRVSYIKAGDYILDGEIEIFCLHPSQDFIVTSANSYSTVLSITYKEFDMLLTGDLEKDGEALLDERLLQNYYQKEWSISPAKDYDIIKIAHHGSKKSTDEEFLEITKPEIAVISCGKDNWYGHPHPELLARLSQTGSKIMITYDSGAVTIKTDGKKLEIGEYIVTKGRVTKVCDKGTG